jgi:chromosomal replication initiator protein
MENPLNPRYTFEAFVPGESNRLAYQMAKSIAKSPGTKYNPGVIYGGVGLGKTHLLHSIGNEILRKRPKASVLYTTVEQFAGEFGRAVRAKNLASFRARYRSFDCLLVDDIQFLICRERPEQEFVWILNELVSLRRQIVVASDRSLKEMSPLGQRLISQLGAGFTTAVKPPGLETRIAILRKKAKAERFALPRNLILFVASSVNTNVRALEGALIRLKAYQAMTNEPITIKDARDILKDSIASDNSSRFSVDVEKILRVVARAFSVGVQDLKGSQRVASIAVPRRVAIYAACVMTELSPADIGHAVGGRDHTSVLRARRWVEKMMGNDAAFRDFLKRLQAKIGQRV